jgi:hypothetical protein
MKVGESFYVQGNYAKRARLAASARKRRLYPEWDYVTRKEGDGIRIWRTA